MGPPPSAQKQFQRAHSEVNDYFPHRITIRKGDSVRWVAAGFHTVDIPARGQDIIPLIKPTGQKVAGVTDAAGTAFWFNGLDQLGFNADVMQSQFGKRVTYNRKRRLASGLPLQEKPKPFTVRFRRTGRFTYFCDVHPGMKGVVRVVGKRSKVPSRRADARAVKRQVASRLALAKRLEDKIVPANVVFVGVAGKGGVERFEFKPSNITVPAGTGVRFRMSPGSFEAHTATTGPGNPMQPGGPENYLGTLTLAPPVFNPIAVYPSERPPTVADLTPTLHGNGFWNSGVMDRDTRTPETPSENGVRLAAPGTYQFFCLIHPFMKATVTVR